MAKSKGLINGDRHNVLDRSLYRKFLRETGIQITQKEFTEIINTTLLEIRQVLLNNIFGFKFPEGLGYAAITRYKPKKSGKSIDWKKTKELGKYVYHLNFHSFGYKAKIAWYTEELSKCKNINLYKFKPDRGFCAELSDKLLEGKIYNEIKYDYFRAKRLKRAYEYKKYKDGILHKQ